MSVEELLKEIQELKEDKLDLQQRVKQLTNELNQCHTKMDYRKEKELSSIKRIEQKPIKEHKEDEKFCESPDRCHFSNKKKGSICLKRISCVVRHNGKVYSCCGVHQKQYITRDEDKKSRMRTDYKNNLSQ